VGRDTGDGGEGIFENRGSFLCQILSAQRMEGKKSLIVKENRERKTSQILFLSPSKNRFSKIPTSFSFSTPSLTASFLVSFSGEFLVFRKSPSRKSQKGGFAKKSPSQKLLRKTIDTPETGLRRTFLRIPSFFANRRKGFRRGLRAYENSGCGTFHNQDSPLPLNPPFQELLSANRTQYREGP